MERKIVSAGVLPPKPPGSWWVSPHTPPNGHKTSRLLMLLDSIPLAKLKMNILLNEKKSENCFCIRFRTLCILRDKKNVGHFWREEIYAKNHINMILFFEKVREKIFERRRFFFI